MWAFGKRANNRVIAMLMVVRGIVWVRQPGDYATFNSHQPRYATREPERQHCIGDRHGDEHRDRDDPGRQPARCFWRLYTAGTQVPRCGGV